MSKLLKFGKNANLSVASVEVDALNPVIFKTKVINKLPNITVDDGKHYRLDTQANTAVEITSDSVSEGAKAAIDSGEDDDGMLALAEQFGLINTVTFGARGDDEDATSGTSDIVSLASSLNMKISEVTVAPQHEIIFRTKGISLIGDLTKDDGKYYSIDTVKNTAQLIDAEKVADLAKADLLKGKNTDYTYLANAFNLISSVTLVRK